MGLGGKGKKTNVGPMLDYANRAIGLQERMYEEGKGLMQPYGEAGRKGLDQLMFSLGLTGDANAPGYGALNRRFTGQDIYQDPSYKFTFDQGQKAAERALAAQGTYLAPAGIQALQEYGQGMASREFQNAYNRFNLDQDTLYGRLASLAGMGQSSAGQLAQAGANFGMNVGDIYQNMGNSIVAAQEAARQRRTSMFNNLIGTAGMAAGAFSDPRLKKNIKLEGVENGHNVYSFEYIHDKDNIRYIGVMADEIQQTNPEAVTEVGGFLAVDYNKIGVDFREVKNGA